MQHKQGFYEKYIKRLLDILCSLVVLVMFWWLYIILAILVRIKLGSPILFKQQRPGKNEKIFNIAERILKITVRTRYFLYGGTNRRNTWKNSFISVY